MSNCCIISIGWLTSSFDSSVYLVMSLVSHCLLYTHHVHLILLLKLCVGMDDTPMFCMIVCFITTFLLYDLLSHVYVGHTFIPFISDSLVSVYFVPFVVVFDI